MRKKLSAPVFPSRLFLVATVWAALLPWFLHAGTQNIDGFVSRMPYFDHENQYSYGVTNTQVIYQTRDYEGRFRSIGTLHQVIVSESRSAVMIQGKLVSIPTFKNAIKLGRHGHFYESVFQDLYLTPDYVFGVLKEQDPENREIVVQVPRTPKNGHYENNPTEWMTLPYSDADDFFIEDQAVTPAEALEKLGKWIQVHPPAEQVIWLETEASAHDDNRLPSPDVAGRGTANSATGPAYFQEFKPDTNAIQVQRRIEGVWEEDELLLADFGSRRDSFLDGKLSPPSVAFKPGREFVAASRRGGLAVNEAMIRTRDDEIRGTITAVDGDTLTIEALDWDRNPYTTTVTVHADASVNLDGNHVDAHAIEAGLNIRVFPERPNQRIVVLNERMAGEASAYKPIAYFHPDQPYGLSSHAFTFDGSHSYDLDGTIVAYDWQFGDGTTASGEVVQHTFTPQGGYQAYPVELTVTNEEGETASNLQYITVVDAMKESRNLRVENLKPGLLRQEWLSGCDLSNHPQCGDPDHLEEVNNTIKATEGDLNRFSGYLKVPEDGWYEFRLPSLSHKLWIGGWLIADHHQAQKESWGPWGLSRLNADVYLEEGFHSIQLLTEQDQRHQKAIGWSGPGLAPRTKTIDEIDGMGNDAVTQAQLILDEDLFYLPSEAGAVTALASVDQKDGVVPFTVHLNAEASMGDIDQYEWKISEVWTGESLADREGLTQSVTFEEPGIYDITLEVMNTPLGYRSSETVQIVARDPNVAENKMGISISFSLPGDLKIHPTTPVGAVPLLNWMNFQKGTSENEVIENSRFTATDTYMEDIDLSGHRNDFLDSSQTNTGDEIMRHWSLKPLGETLVLRDLPQVFVDQGYDVYVYPVSSSGNVFRVSVDDTDRWIKVADRRGIWDGEYVLSTAETQAEASDGDISTHVVFEDRTLDHFNLSMGNDSSAGFAGLQIVTDYAVPDPADRLEQSISFFEIGDRNKTDAPFHLFAKADSDLSVDFSIMDGPATLSGNLITLSGEAGIVTVKARQAGNDFYQPAEFMQSFRVIDDGKTDQSLQFDSIPDKDVTEENFQVQAAASSGLPVHIQVVSGPAVMVDANTVSLSGEVGEVILQAAQGGNDSFNPAPITYKRFTVNTPPEDDGSTEKPFENWLNQYDLQDRNPDSVTDGVIKKGKRVTLREAFLWGEDPNDPNDVIHIKEIQPRRQEGLLRLYFPSLEGRRYTLEASDTLQEEGWTHYSAAAVNGNNDISFLTMSMDPGEQPYRFYRLRVEPAP